MSETFEIFCVVPPGLEPVLTEELSGLGWRDTHVQPGGVSFQGGWPDIWRANLLLRLPVRILARIGGFRAMHLAQLDKRASKFDWSLFKPGQPIKVEVTSRKSRIYHAGAARQRIEKALGAHGLTLGGEDALTLRARIDDDFCTFSIDTSGEALHKRGHKVAVNKAPMRETLAAAFLRMCQYDGREPVVDPMCGSGTFVIEAAEIAAGLAPGRSRAFAFQSLASFDANAFETIRPAACAPTEPALFYGFDRDQGAIGMAQKNAARATVDGISQFAHAPISALVPPCEAPGLVIANPPYGARIGNKKALYGLYSAFGARLKDHFGGWRFGFVTSDKGLARATGLDISQQSAPIPHGGLKVFLFQGHIGS